MHHTFRVSLRLWVALVLQCGPAFGDPQESPGIDAASSGPMTELNSTAGANLTTAWQSEPNGRGTFSLIVSCLLTLTLCVWSALHLNVPGQRTSLRGRILEKAKWVLYGIFAPELVVATAAAQFITARWLRKQIELDSQYRKDRILKGEGLNGMSTHTWTLSQCFYAVMGGFAADSPWVDFRSRYQPDTTGNSESREDVEEGLSARKRVAITAEGIRLMSLLGRLPHIHESQIQDKSKADWMAKSLICIQVGWMVVQVIGRVIMQMPVSLLEINTCGHVACAMAIYLLWWSKPLEIQEPTLLNDEQDQDKDTLALMYMCSSIGAVDGITDIRCFIHVVTEEDEGYWRLPPKVIQDWADGHETDDPSDEAEEGMTELTTFLSIGSPGTEQPYPFLGFRSLRSGEDKFVALQKLRLNPERRKEPQNSAYIYRFNYDKPPISKDCRVYYSSPYTDDPMPSLRHSRYCRRALNEQSGGTSQYPHIPAPLALLRSASKAADILRAQCSANCRPSYTAYYFTHVKPALGEFLGETEYIIRDRIPNFPSLHNLGLGQVNIHRDRLRSVLALTAAGYGALHCAGWPSSTNNPGSAGTVVKFFPTSAERILWIVSSLTIAVSGGLLWAFYLARQFLPAFDRWVSGVAPGQYIANEGIRNKRLRKVNRIVDVIKKGSVYVVLGLFALARVYLVVEAFMSLRDAPVGLYETPEWTDFLPHF